MNPYPYLLSLRCGAKTRQNTACQSPAVSGNKRCRMHGGKGSGAPRGNQNALKHGYTTARMKQFKKTVKEVIKANLAIKEPLV
jgi:glucans biosynthesis protein